MQSAKCLPTAQMLQCPQASPVRTQEPESCTPILRDSRIRRRARQSCMHICLNDPVTLNRPNSPTMASHIISTHSSTSGPSFSAAYPHWSPSKVSALGLALTKGNQLSFPKYAANRCYSKHWSQYWNRTEAKCIVSSIVRLSLPIKESNANPVDSRGFTLFELATIQLSNDKCGFEQKDDTNVVSAAMALQALGQQPNDRPSRLNIFRVDCPHCKQIWLIKHTSFPVHKCLNPEECNPSRW